MEMYHRIQGDAWSSPVVDNGMNVLTVAGVDQNVYPETGYYRASASTQAILYHAGLWIRASRAGAEAFFA